MAVMTVALPAVAQEVGAYGFLELPASSRSAALGGVCTSVVEPDLALSDQNPALLCPEMAGQLSLSYINYVSDINLGYAAYCGHFLDEGAWSTGVHYLNYGDFQGYDESGIATGSFSARDLAFHFAVGHAMSRCWNVGATFRGIYSKYDIYSAFAIGVDVGLNYYNEASGRSISITATNLGGQLKKMNDRSQHLPTQLSIGWTKEVEHLPFCFTLTAYRLLDWDQDYVNGSGEVHKYTGGEQLLNHLLWGAEWIVNDNLFFAASYSFRRQREFSGAGGFLRGVSLGGGLKFRQFSLQGAYSRYNAADGSFHLGLSYNFQSYNN